MYLSVFIYVQILINTKTVINIYINTQINSTVSKKTDVHLVHIVNITAEILAHTKPTILYSLLLPSIFLLWVFVLLGGEGAG